MGARAGPMGPVALVSMARRTKIIATIGPASEDERTLKGLIAGGHGHRPDQPLPRVARAGPRAGTTASARWRPTLGRPVGILVDLPGPKVRVGHMPEEGLDLVEGQEFCLTPGHGVEHRRGHRGRLRRAAHRRPRGRPAHLRRRRRAGPGPRPQGRPPSACGSSTAGTSPAARASTSRPSGCASPPRPPTTSAWPTPSSRSGVDMLALSFVRSAHDVRRIGVEPNPRGPAGRRQDRDAGRGREPRRHRRGVGRGDGRPWRPRLRVPHRGAPAPPEGDHPALHRPGSAGHHRHPDARVDDPRPEPHPGRGLRRGQRRVRRLVRRDALGRDRHRQRPGPRRRRHGPHRRAGRRRVRLQRLVPGPGRACTSTPPTTSRRRSPTP